jgi:hypothetical protein
VTATHAATMANEVAKRVNSFFIGDAWVEVCLGVSGNA